MTGGLLHVQFHGVLRETRVRERKKPSRAGIVLVHTFTDRNTKGVKRSVCILQQSKHLCYFEPLKPSGSKRSII